jgi:hypothetical protein
LSGSASACARSAGRRWDGSRIIRARESWGKKRTYGV